MDFKSQSEIREQIARYLAGDMSLDDFEDWFVSRSWNFQEASYSLQDLVSKLELLFAEFSDGHWTEGELRQSLRPLVTAYTVDLQESQQSSSFGTSSRTQFNELVFLPNPSQSFDTQFVGASV